MRFGPESFPLRPRGAPERSAWPLQYRARRGITLTGSEGLAYLGERYGRRFVVLRGAVS